MYGERAMKEKFIRWASETEVESILSKEEREFYTYGICFKCECGKVNVLLNQDLYRKLSVTLLFIHECIHALIDKFPKQVDNFCDSLHDIWDYLSSTFWDP